MTVKVWYIICKMHPILFSLGPVSISSFGFFLALAFLVAVFISWRLAHLYDLNEEKILDLAILTFFGGILGARIFFVGTNWELFGTFYKAILLNRYPGLSFWGGLVGGSLTLYFFARRTKFNFWQIADFAGVSLLIGIVLGDLGCFLGGCAYGVTSNLPLAFPVVGVMGKRFPVSVLESMILLFAFFPLFRAAVRFHFAGKIAAFSLITLGIVKFLTEFWRGDNKILPFLAGISLGHFFSTGVLILGIGIFYQKSKRSAVADLKGWAEIFYLPNRRQILLLQIKKSWYNFKITWEVKIKKAVKILDNLPKILKRRFNVKSTPKNTLEN